MNKFTKGLLIGATVIGFSGATFAAQDAQNADGKKAPAREWQHKPDPAKFREHMAKRQAELHDKLKLSAAQEPAWKTFTAAMTPQEPGKRPDRAEWDKLTAPERMEKMLSRMKERETKMTAQLAALKTFYAQLSPEQQKVFNDNVGKGFGHHREHHGPGARGRHDRSDEAQRTK